MELLQLGDTVFSRFRVDQVWRGGGQSFGFLGEDLDAPPHRPWEKPVFIKQFRDLLPGTREARVLGQHFRALGERLRDKSHFFCLPRYVGEENNSVIAVYPHIFGKSLDDLLNERLSKAQSCRVAIAIANGVRLLHESGIAHLDLKPENVLVEENPKNGKSFVRLIDLDAARIDGVGLRNRVIGTPGYNSPEHFDSRRYGDVSEKSDVFSLGVLLFVLLLGQHPFPKHYQRDVEMSAVDIPPNSLHREVLGRILGCFNVDAESRPKASWLHSILHAHYGSCFEARDPADRWVPRYVRLDTGAGFRRVFYRSEHLGSTSFRGSGISDLPARFLVLRLTGETASLELTREDVSVSVCGTLLSAGNRIPLKGGDSLVIEGKSFSILLDE